MRSSDRGWCSFSPPTRWRMRERTDSTVVPAAAVVAEAMVALVLAGAYREKFGGDHIDDVLSAVPRATSSLHGHPWRRRSNLKQLEFHRIVGKLRCGIGPQSRPRLDR